MLMNIKTIYRKYGKTILIHSQVWILLFILNYIFTRNFDVKLIILYQFVLSLIYIAVFYLNYSCLIPWLLFRSKTAKYILFSLIIILAATYIRLEVDMHRKQKEFDFNVKNGSFMQQNPGEQFRKRDNFTIYPKNEKTGPTQEQFNGGKNQQPPFKHPPYRMILISFYSILLVYTGSISFRFIGKWQDDEKRRSEIEKENIATELSFLKQQINPHFLFNSLNSIYSLTISKSDKAVDSILKLSSILRYMLYESGTTLVLFQDELQIVNDYIELQKLRITEKVKLLYTVKGDAGTFKIEPFILLPLIENAFKYGVDNYNDSVIEILIAVHQNKLMMAVRNSIVKRSGTLKSEGGIGIKNIKRRLDLLYPNDYLLTIDETNEFYTVKLEIKLKE
jgi:two-component system LytT family sensor kinase